MTTPLNDAMREKSTRQLPSLRVSETLESALMRLAAADDRSLSEYIKLVLLRHVMGYGATLQHDVEDAK